MTTRRPQDPRTRRIPDEEAVVPTLSPGGAFDPGATVMPDAGATVMPDPGATVMPVDQRHVETVDPGATVLPEGLEAPKPRAQRGGGVVRGGAATVVERTMTADSLEAVRQQVRAKAEAEAKASGAQKKAKTKKRQGAGWGTWVVAFLLLGGVGFGVAWLIMNPPGGAGESVATAAPTEDAAASAGDGAGEDASAAEAAKAEDAATQADTQAAAAPDAAPVADTAAPDTALAAAPSDAAEAADAVAQAEVAPDTAADTAAAQADAAPAGGDVQVAQADGAPSPAPDAASTAPDAAVAIVDAQAPEVAPAPKPFIANPIEAARLNEDGLARRKAGDNAGAMRFYEQALAADPDHVWSRYNLACELALAGRDKEALAELTKLHKLGTADARRALQAARKDSDFRSIKDNGQFFRLTNF